MPGTATGIDASIAVTTKFRALPIPAWKVFWSLFGASNQLLAALSLIAVTVWIYHTYKARWTWLVTGGPTIWMFVMSVWTLVRFVKTGFLTPTGDFKGIPTDAVTWVALLLITLSLLISLEAGKVVKGGLKMRRYERQLKAVTP